MGGRSVQGSVCVYTWPEVCVCVYVQYYYARTSIKMYMTTNLVITVMSEPLVHVTRALPHQSKHASEQISAYSASVAPCEWTRVSYSRDDQWGGEEQRSQQAAPTVCILPLALVHLSTAVVTAAAQAEEEPDHWHENGEEQAHRRTHEEADLIVDGLEWMVEVRTAKKDEDQG